jgi:hypothetical protein
MSSRTTHSYLFAVLFVLSNVIAFAQAVTSGPLLAQWRTQRELPLHTQS